MNNSETSISIKLLNIREVGHHVRICIMLSQTILLSWYLFLHARRDIISRRYYSRLSGWWSTNGTCALNFELLQRCIRSVLLGIVTRCCPRGYKICLHENILVLFELPPTWLQLNSVSYSCIIYC